MSEAIKVKTPSGFTAEILPEALDDMELLDDLCRLDAGEEWIAAKVVLRLLGAEGKKKLYDFCRDPETHRVTVSKVSQVLSELFAAPEVKK